MSHETFKVGEIALGTNHVDMPEFNGMECEILTPLAWREAVQKLFDRSPLPAGFYHKVRFANGVEVLTTPSRLRKRRPPQDWVKLCNLTDIPREVAHG